MYLVSTEKSKNIDHWTQIFQGSKRKKLMRKKIKPKESKSSDMYVSIKFVIKLPYKKMTYQVYVFFGSNCKNLRNIIFRNVLLRYFLLKNIILRNMLVRYFFLRYVHLRYFLLKSILLRNILFRYFLSKNILLRNVKCPPQKFLSRLFCF